jgi:hypothetical protein
MAQIVKLRRSSVSGQKPTNSNLQLGELALNTTDGKVYMAKSGSLGPTVEELISTNTVNTGSINLIGDITSSNVSSSFIGDGSRLYNIPLSGVTNLTTISGSIDNRLDVLETLSQSFTGSISGSMTGSLYTDYIVFNSSSAATLQSYMLQANTTDKTLDLRLGNNATLQLGQELYYPPIVNKSGGPLVNGALVMFNPADPTQGNRISVVKCISNGTYPAEYIVGILTEDVAVNDEGFATWFGYVRDISRTELQNAGLKDSAETWSEGQILYPHPTRPGGLTNVQPLAPNLKSSICVITSINGVNITFLVRPHLRGSLKGLHDVSDTTTTSTYGDLLVNSGSVWTNSKSLNGNYAVTGSLTITQNLTVLGSSSLVYVTSSQLAVSASFISVNVFEPAERFGGLKVYDSGSSNATASLAWDSLHNHWVYQNASGSSYSGGMLLAGPRNSGSLGEEPNLISGRIVKSVGGDHIDVSIISETDNTINVAGHLNAYSITGSLNFGDLTDLPTLVSSSSQIEITGTTGYSTFSSSISQSISILSGSISSSINLLSGSIATTTFNIDGRLDDLETESGSIRNNFNNYTSSTNNRLNSIEGVTESISLLNQFTSSYNTGSFSGLFTGSYIGDGYGLYNIPASGVTGLELNKITSGSVSASISPDRGLEINTNVYVDGTLTAKELYISYVTSSVLYESGSTKFGDTLDDIHEFTGSVYIDGNLNVDSITGSIDFSNLTNKPTLVSSSSQISYTGITDIPNGIVSGSSQILNGSGIWSSSVQLPNGIVSGSSQIIYSGITNIPNGIVSGSSQILDLGFTTTSSFESFTSSYTNDSSSFDSRINTITGSIIELNTFTSSINTFTASVVLTSQTSSMSVLSSSYALTASYALNGGGGGTEGRTARLDQTTPSNTWTFNHNLGEQFPVVTIYDFSNNVVIPSTIKAQDNNTLIISFSSLQLGTATATVGGGLPFISSSFDGYVLSGLDNAPTWKGGIVSGSLQISNFGYATTGSNTFINNQTINGSLSIIESLIQQITSTGVTTNTIITSFPTGSYDSGFFDYVIKDGVNMRAGTVTSVWTPNNIEFNEVTTNDLGDTTNVIMSVTLSGGNANLNANISSGNWTIKVLSRGL